MLAVLWEPSGVITLLTDFGARDPFVGVMKGVILGINPAARVVDVTHEVGPHDVVQAAFLLNITHGFFPVGSVHVVVVDPGVGSARRPLLVVTDHYAYVGPDNGVLSPAFAGGQATRVIALTATRFFRQHVSTTFHGRDIFAPVAAWLSTGIAPSEFGEGIPDHSRLDLPSPALTEEAVLRGEVVYVDRFGNAMTNVTLADLDGIADRRLWGALCVRAGSVEVCGLCRCYEDSSPGVPAALVNSWGYVELYIREENASRKLGLSRGQRVEIFLAEELGSRGCEREA